MKNVPESAKRNYVVHTVKKGETLLKIASRYGVSKNDLADANNISTKTKLSRGVKLRIPVTNLSTTDYAYNSNVETADDDNLNESGEYVSPYVALNTSQNETDNSESGELNSSEENTNGIDSEPSLLTTPVTPAGKVRCNL
ncbi:MAG: LysM peptidoglycan-binding domain-containing protein [Ignavibacteriales bacterium]|nr:LysM peptidoglycan-binding domain-containing protein [Ignavibacteriales bacterium]